eukprot:4187601-Amphidinium_carterae.2
MPDLNITHEQLNGPGRFLTFTTVFPHPPDRPGAAYEAAKHQFQADGRRFPRAHYAKHNLVWARDAFA